MKREKEKGKKIYLMLVLRSQAGSQVKELTVVSWVDKCRQFPANIQ